MEQREAVVAPAAVRPGHAWMDVRRGRIWTGARVPVELSLHDGELTLRVVTIQLTKAQRSALVRLCGDDVLSTIIASREEPEIAVPLAGTEFRYPSIPGLGRTAMEIRMAGRPPLALSFVDPGRTGDPLTDPRRFTLRIFRAGPAARRERDRWKGLIEACR